MDLVLRYYFADLAVVLVILTNMLTPCLALPRPEFGIMATRTDHNRLGADDFAHSTLVRTPRWVKSRRWSLDPIKVKLDNVIDKYEIRRGLIKNLYAGFIACEDGGCPKFREYIPENQTQVYSEVQNKRPHNVRKQIPELLEKFREGLLRIKKGFQLMEKFEESPEINHGGRNEILKEFKTDIEGLTVEVDLVMGNIGMDLVHDGNGAAASAFVQPRNQTDLMMQEWYVIQESRRFLEEWDDIMKKLTKHLKKQSSKSKSSKE